MECRPGYGFLVRVDEDENNTDAFTCPGPTSEAEAEREGVPVLEVTGSYRSEWAVRDLNP